LVETNKIAIAFAYEDISKWLANTPAGKLCALCVVGICLVAAAYKHIERLH